MNLKKLVSREIIITMVSVILISITFFSVSYAIYMTVDERAMGTLSFADLSFESCTNSECQNVGEDLGNSLINISAVPITDAEGLVSDPYSFKVTNSGNLQLVVYIYIGLDANTTTYDFSKLRVASKESTASDYTIQDYGENELFVAYTVTLDSAESKTFDVLLWAGEEIGNDIIGKNFVGYVNAVAYYYPEDEDELHTIAPAGTNTIPTAQFINQFAYTGDYQTYTVPATGWYNVELWGASGGNGSTTYIGGKGGYSSGVVYLNQAEAIYIYIGGAGPAVGTATNTAGGYNGGGNCYSYAANYVTGCGGGATDIRLVSGVWNNSTSLNSRIMVAGGGGGGHYRSDTSSYGGNGGGLVGGLSYGETSAYAELYPGGGTQIAGGAKGYVDVSTRITSLIDSGFGFGGSVNTSSLTWNLVGGGSGYYGGGAGVFMSGSGGSSFISGYAGVNAITSASSTTPTNNTIHYSGKYFINGVMSNGINSGNGKAKITFIGVNKPNKTNTKLNGVRYIKNCTNGSNADIANAWVQLQAIYNGTNVAKSKTVTMTSPALYDNAWWVASTKITDGDISAGTHTVNFGLQCITIDLTQTYDLDEVAVWHYWGDSRTFYSNTTYVSSDNTNWNLVMSKNSSETSEGQRISAYNSTSGISEFINNYDYTGGVQTFTAPVAGNYKLETWGASGGSTTYRGGYGGYSKGTVYLEKNAQISIYVGGAGGSSTVEGAAITGGYNGGGSGYGKAGGGGGATHIATVSGLLSTLSSNIDKILIVAGGGGGSVYYSDNYASAIGGSGGGYIGETATPLGTWENPEVGGRGGTQSAGGLYGTITGGNIYGISGSFGAGANGTYAALNYNPGGGGGFYGGGNGRHVGGGGGSGYIANTNLTSKYMYCYNCPTSSDTNTKTYSTTNYSATPTSDYAKSGNGYAKITYIP